MSLSLILPMSAFALAASISPGPVTLVCLSSGSRYPLPRGMIFAAGASWGFIALFLAIGYGLNALLLRHPDLERWLTGAGIAFLLYLSYRLACDNGELGEQNTESAPGFFSGALMQWLNPKAWLASATGIGAYTQGADSSQLWLFAAVYLPICWLSLSTWVAAGAFLSRSVKSAATLRAINRSLAVLLAGSCVFLLIP